ncbi:MAG: TrmH family RNA methyltransferase, partial [Planctomycetota bacterium]
SVSAAVFLYHFHHLERPARLPEAESFLVSDKRIERLAPILPPDAPVYVVPHELMTQIAGFEIHTGALAVGFRRPTPELERIVPADGTPQTLLICPQIKEAANLGALIRVSAAFGLHGLLLGPTCCDPFSRRALRVSMGTAFRLNIRHSPDLDEDLRSLRRDFGFTLYATVLDEGATPLKAVERPSPPDPDRVGILMGNEVHGLDAGSADIAQHRVTIPMSLGVDSLNVSVSAAVFLYHFHHLERPARLPEAERWDAPED